MWVFSHTLLAAHTRTHLCTADSPEEFPQSYHLLVPFDVVLGPVLVKGQGLGVELGGAVAWEPPHPRPADAPDRVKLATCAMIRRLVAVLALASATDKGL